MKHKLLVKHALGLAFVVLAVLFTACIKEDLDECNRLTLKVVNVQGEDITALDDVKDAILYIFDENKNLLEQRMLDADFITSRKVIELDYPVDKKLHLIAWGNLSTDKQTVETVKTMDDLNIMLKSQNALAQSPDSLFYGNKDVITSTLGVLGGNQEIVIAPKTGTIKIETRGLENGLKYHGLRSSLRSGEEFNFYMDSTLSGYNPNGELIGDKVYYNPQGKLEEAEWKTTKDQNVCAGQNLTFSIDVNGQLLGSVSEGTNHKTNEVGPFKVLEGQLTYVIITFGEDGSISARMRITPWGTVDQDIEF